MEDINIQISDLESQIALLPVGYISKKMINGKERYYQQWTENGKIKSKYIKNEEVEEFQKKIEFPKIPAVEAFGIEIFSCIYRDTINKRCKVQSQDYIWNRS